MQFKRITITTFDGVLSKNIIGRLEYPILKEFNDISIATKDSDELIIISNDGINSLFSISDVRLHNISDHVFRYVGYLTNDFNKKYKRHTKVFINIFNS